MKCSICEEEFTPKNGSHIYCTPYCRGKAREQGDERRLKMNEYRKEWKQKNPDTHYTSYRNSHLLRNFGITEEKYQELLQLQNNSCAICGKSQEAEKRNLAVDHNHITREIRGLLCGYCNRRVVGRHRDGALLRKIADYVEQGTGLFVPEKVKPRRRKRKVSENSV
jgi:DNA-directed RNA polymerase subunit RPC12/RpoP